MNYQKKSNQTDRISIFYRHNKNEMLLTTTIPLRYLPFTIFIENICCLA